MAARRAFGRLVISGLLRLGGGDGAGLGAILGVPGRCRARPYPVGRAISVGRGTVPDSRPASTHPRTGTGEFPVIWAWEGSGAERRREPGGRTAPGSPG